MTIDIINISTFGMKLLTQTGYFDLPARKKILAVPGTQAKDIVLQSKEATISLMGKYTDATAMLTNLNAFETLIKSTLKHNIVLIGHGLSFTGVFDKGYEVTSYAGGRVVKVVATITVS